MWRTTFVLLFAACSGDIPGRPAPQIDIDAADVSDTTADTTSEPWSCAPPPIEPLPSDATPRPASLIGAPIVLDVATDLGLEPSFAIASIATHPTSRRVYLGRYGSSDRASRDLTVVALDAAGAVVRQTRVAIASTPRSASISTNAQVLVVAPDGRKLYVASTPLVGELSETLSVIDLDEYGDPITTPSGVAVPRTFDVGNSAIYAMFRHPTAPILYIGGYADLQIHAVHLDPQGEPTTTTTMTLDPAPVGGIGITDLVVAPDGQYLYVGGVGLLEAYRLSPDGLTATLAASLPMPPPPEGAYDHVRIALSGARIVRRSGGFPPSLGLPAPPISITLVDGLPTNITIANGALIDAVGLSTGHFIVNDSSYRDALTDEPIPADLTLETPTTTTTIYDRAAVIATTFADDTPVVLVQARTAAGSRHRDVLIRARVDAIEFDGLPFTDPDELLVPQFFLIGTDYYEGAYVRLHEMSDWFSLDRVLANLTHAPAAYISVAGAPTRVTLTVEVALGDPANGGRLLATRSLESEGPDVLMRVPGLGVPDADLSKLARSERDVALEHAAYATSIGLPEGQRPKLYPIGFYSVIGVQNDRVALDALASTIGALGCNMILPISWTGIPDDILRDTLARHGITRRSGSTYTPPSYFDFERTLMSPANLAPWANEVLDYSLPDGSPIDALAHITIADEPGWYYPEMLEVVRDDPAKLQFFHNFLDEQGLTPADLGASDWSEVLPLGKPLDTTQLSLSERMRLYWTLRFFPIAAARGLGLAADAMRAAAGRDVPIHVNWNNWGVTSWHYNSWPGQVENNGTQSGPERGSGSVDWYETARLGKQHLFTEDWLPDNMVDLWSFRLDILRTAATQTEPVTQVPMGAYVIPNAAGTMREGLSYKILSLLGRGGNVVELFNFGPSSLQSDGWSDQTVLYEPIARALRRVALAEHVMFDGIPERGRVAILLPAESLTFDEWSETDYTFEAEALHRALMHAGFRVDILDPKGVALGQLQSKNYAVLYIPGPNIPTAARDQIRDWVTAGGTLVISPDAAVADAYDTLTSDLDDLLGLAPRQRVRAPSELPFTARPHRVDPITNIVDARAGPLSLAELLPISGRTTRLTPTTAEPIAWFSDGTPAITRQRTGAGQSIAYGFLAGSQYEAAMPRDLTHRFPDGDSTLERSLAIWPAIDAGAYGSVRTPDMIEALRLDGPAGTAIVLLDWRNDPRDCVTIDVSNIEGTARSIEGRRIDQSATPTGQRLVLERLEAIDIILFESPNAPE